MKKLSRIKAIKACTVFYTIEEPYTRFAIEPEVIEYAKWLNKIIPKRVLTPIENTKGEQGLIGQELFNGFLLQFKIPNIYANPLYEDPKMRQMRAKHFDFIVPHLPKGKRIISVKTIPEGHRNIRFMANVESWKNEAHNIAIAIKIESLLENKAHIAGWLYAHEIENLPTHDFGTGLAYWTYLDPRHVQEKRNYEQSGYASLKLKPLNSTHHENLIENLLSGSIDLPAL